MKEVEKNIDENTVCLLVSAPSFATGRFEPVARFARLAKKYQVGCHVDSALGMLYPFLDDY